MLFRSTRASQCGIAATLSANWRQVREVVVFRSLATQFINRRQFDLSRWNWCEGIDSAIIVLILVRVYRSIIDFLQLFRRRFLGLIIDVFVEVALFFLLVALLLSHIAFLGCWPSLGRFEAFDLVLVLILIFVVFFGETLSHQPLLLHNIVNEEAYNGKETQDTHHYADCHSKVALVLLQW